MFVFFFFNDTATTEIYTLSLHDALPIFPYRASTSAHNVPDTQSGDFFCPRALARPPPLSRHPPPRCRDRKSTRLNSSHSQISYAVFCLKKKIRKPPLP